MSRSGYIDDFDDQWQQIKWRGQVASATRGKRGQKLLRELLSALDAMPEKRLITEELEHPEEGVCALGAVGKLRGIDMSLLDPEEPDQVAAALDIAEPLAREIVYMNDEYYCPRECTPEERFVKMRTWVASLITREGAAVQSRDANKRTQPGAQGEGAL